MRGYKMLRILCVALMLTLMVFQINAVVSASYLLGTHKDTPYPVFIEYRIMRKDIKKVVIEPGGKKVFTAIPVPSGFELKYVKVECVGQPPEGLKFANASRYVEKAGRFIAALYENENATVVNEGEKPIEVTLAITQVFAKVNVCWTDGKSLTFEVAEPPEPFKLEEVEVHLTIYNYIPLKVVDVKTPEGVSLLSTQDKYPADAVEVDPKHVVLHMQYGLKPGKYTFVFDKDKARPSAFIVFEWKPISLTILPGASEKIVASHSNFTGELVGYIIVTYSLSTENAEAEVEIISESTYDYLYSENKEISIETTSYLIPPIDLTFNLKAYVVFGGNVTVHNCGVSPVNVLVIPVTVKEAGLWTNDGVAIEVKEEDVKACTSAYIVLQLPHYISIRKVITPRGKTYFNLVSSKIAVESKLAARKISIFDHQMYLQVKGENFEEVGVYKIVLDRKPFKVIALDGEGRPVANAVVELAGKTTGLKVANTTDAQGLATLVPLAPDVYTLRISFKDVEVYATEIYYIPDSSVTAKCKIYDLTVAVRTLLGQPVAGAEVKVKRSEGTLELDAVTDENGEACFKQVPFGKYQVKVHYKRVEDATIVELSNSSKRVDITLDVLFEIPLLGLPVKSGEAGATFLSLLGLTVIGLIKRSRRKKSESEIDESLLEEEEYP